MGASASLKYRAFISYSRADRAWAKELQTRLERYVLPAALRLIAPGRRHDARPLKPVFRDESELVPGQDLSQRIRQGLEQSEFLIVVCSPNAARSEWVNKEVLEFVALGRADSILAVVVAGEPNATDRGLSADNECLPPALRFEADVYRRADGAMSARVSERKSEPLWLDWRTPTSRDRMQFLRLVAALLSLGSLDELIRRDRVQRRREIAVRAALTAAAIIAASGGGLAYYLQSSATAARASITLSDLSAKALDAGNDESAARYALMALNVSNLPLDAAQKDPAERILAQVLESDRRTAIALRLPHEANRQYKFSHDGRLLLAWSGSRVRLVDTQSGSEIGDTLETPHDVAATALSRDSRLIAVAHSEPGKSVDGDTQYVVDVWRVPEMTKVRSLRGNLDSVTSMAFSPDAGTLAVAGEFADQGSTVRLWNIESGTGRDIGGTPSNTDGMAWSLDGRILAATSAEGVHLFQVGQSAGLGDPIACASKFVQGGDVAFSADGKTLAVNVNDRVSFCAVGDSQEYDHLPFRLDVVSIAYPDNDAYFGVELSDGSMEIYQQFLGGGVVNDRVLNASERKPVRIQPAEAFAFLPGGTRIVTVSGDFIRIWHVKQLVEKPSASPVDSSEIVRAVCDQILPGQLSHLTPAEMSASPILEGLPDDACHR